MADDFVLNVRQILQYPNPTPGIVQGTDALLLQRGGLGGPYVSAQIKDALLTALGGISWDGNRSYLTWFGGRFYFNQPVVAPEFDAEAMFINGDPVATHSWVTANEVTSFNFRSGAVQLLIEDIKRAGGAPVLNPHLLGWCTATTPLDLTLTDDTIATTRWVSCAFSNYIAALALTGGVVTSFDGRGGDVLLNADDITFACTQTGAQPRSNTPPGGDASTRLATTAFVDDGLVDLKLYIDDELTLLTNTIIAQALAQYAPLASPAFTGVPTAPTANPGTATGQLATTAFVTSAVSASVAGVSSFNTRTGPVVLIAADITAAGGALLSGPTFTGVPKGPTAAPGDNTTQLASTAFVHAAIAAVSSGGVLSFNTRTGAVSLTLTDVTGTGVLSNTPLTGVPTAPTAPAATNTTQVATTAFVTAAVTGVVGVASFNSRTGAVSLIAADISAAGGALVASPTFTGIPAAPTAGLGTNTTQLATTAFVQAAILSGTNVVSFNGRNGAVTLNASDISGAGGAILNSPAFTGTPTAPTPSPGDNSAKIATTAFITSALAASGVETFNTRTGNVVLLLADITAAGGAPIASPVFTGIPAGPTAAPSTSTTQLATTAFVTAAVTAGAVTSFNSRTGAVALLAADVSAVGGAMIASPTFTGTPQAPTPSPGDSTGKLATTAFVANAMAGGAGVVTFNTRAGAVTLLAADITGATGALLASPTFTGVPAAPTASPGTNTTQLATTAFALAAAAAAGVTSFNTRTGPVTLSLADVTGVGGAPIASPTFTGTPAAPTPSTADSTTKVATTAYVQANLASFAPLASPTFTGDPKVPTATAGDNDTSAASTAFVQTAIAPKAPLASPAFTGAPTAPTPPPADNSTAVATTAFVNAATVASATPIKAYWSGTINLTNTAATNSNDTVNHVFGFAAAHGIATGSFGSIGGTTVTGLAANTGYYLRALTATTIALYNSLADANADANRVTWSGGGTGMVFRIWTYSGVFQNGFDPVCPIGSKTAQGPIAPELNLVKPLAGLFAIVLIGRINGLNGATSGTPQAWIAGTAPTIVSTTLIGFYAVSWAQNFAVTVPSGGGSAVQNPGNHSGQSLTSWYAEFVVIG